MYLDTKNFEVERFLPGSVVPGEEFDVRLVLKAKVSGKYVWVETPPPEAEHDAKPLYEFELIEGESAIQMYKASFSKALFDGHDPEEIEGPVTFKAEIRSKDQSETSFLFSPMAFYRIFHINDLDDFGAIRKRLVRTVNYHPSEFDYDPMFGHLFVGNPLRFMREFMQCRIASSLEELVYEEFQFLDRGLPIEDEEFDEIRQNKNGIWGLELFTLEFEEDCDEETFDHSASFEVDRPNEDNLAT